MKTRYNILYISVLFLTGMTACAKEDTLTPEVDTNIDCFAPAADAMDEESVLRRTFSNRKTVICSLVIRFEEKSWERIPMVICNILLNCWMSTIPWALVRARPLPILTNCCRAWKRRSKRPPFCTSMYCLTCPRP